MKLQPNKRHLILGITSCVLICSGFLVILTLMAEELRNNPGSFIRTFPPHPIIEKSSINVHYNSYYIAGHDATHLYLGNTSAPFHLLAIDRRSEDTTHVTVRLKQGGGLIFHAPKIRVHGSYFYFIDGTVPFLYRGNVGTWELDTLLTHSVFFQDIIPAVDRSFFLRALNQHGQNTIGKLSLNNDLMMAEGILEKQLDGLFCTDGMLLFDDTENIFTYLYRFRNQFILMDTALNVLERFHTIDTTTKVKIRIDTIHSTGMSTILNPEKIVNKRACTHHGLIFVNSNMPAKNEHVSAFDHASVIDAYQLSTGAYLFSFYINHYAGKEKLRDMAIVGDHLYVLFEQHLQVWELDKQIFQLRRSNEGSKHFRAENQGKTENLSTE